VRVSVPLTALPDASPEQLLRSLPGCRSISPGADGGLRIVVDVAVAAVRGLWAGTLTETGPGRWHLVGAGEPGKADLAVRLDDDRSTLVIEGTVEGPLATIGSALLAAAVRRTVLSLMGRTSPADRRQKEGTTP
jgi:uncharacterized protein